MEHGELRRRREQLRSDADRWMGELEQGSPRSTLSVGVLKRGCSHAEGLLKACAAVYVSASVDAESEVRSASNGKTGQLGKLTLGETIKLLATMDKERRLGNGRRVIGTADRKLLDRVSTARNGFIHSDPFDTLTPDAIKNTLADVRQLADIKVVELADRLESSSESPT